MAYWLRTQTLKLDYLGSNPYLALGKVTVSGGASGKEPAWQQEAKETWILSSGPSGRSPKGGHGNPLQYFCLENPMDREAWWSTVHEITKSDMTEHTRTHTHTHTHTHTLLLLLS